MVSVTEALGQGNQLEASLKAGLESIDQQQTITFTKYVKVILPLDGFVFWVKADLMSPSALLNASALNAVLLAQPSQVEAAAPTLTVKGSLHVTTDQRQSEDESYTVNRIVFTSEIEVQPLNEIGPTIMWIAEFEGIEFAFSRRRSYYRQAGIHHYEGEAVYPALRSQVIHKIEDLNVRQLVVSNSLPIWLAMFRFDAPYIRVKPPTVEVYPSFLSKENLRPPYISVHIEPSSQRPMQAFASHNGKLSQEQLIAERVRLTLYGLGNDAALDLMNFVEQYSLASDYSNPNGALGLISNPVMRDEVRTQQELNVRAMKKALEFEITYYQRRLRNLSVQFITSCTPSYTIA